MRPHSYHIPMQRIGTWKQSISNSDTELNNVYF